LSLTPFEEFQDLDVLILAVNHSAFLAAGVEGLLKHMNSPSVFIDVKSCFDPKDFPDQVAYWSLW
jgi:UDP-N-acetyl-D-mannosaminuronate dehydrogenase